MTNKKFLETTTEFAVSIKMVIASMVSKEKNANTHTLRCVENLPNMAATNKEDAIQEKNVKISILKCASTHYAKENVSINPVVLLM